MILSSYKYKAAHCLLTTGPGNNRCTKLRNRTYHDKNKGCYLQWLAFFFFLLFLSAHTPSLYNTFSLLFHHLHNLHVTLMTSLSVFLHSAMASKLAFFSGLLVLLVATLGLFASPACSTSRRALEQPKLNNTIGFRVPLKHIDSGKNLTKFERIKNGIARGQHRLQRLNALILDSAYSMTVPVHIGSGEFLMRFSMGTPPAVYYSVLDSGSDLIWSKCKTCGQLYCYHPKESSSFQKALCSSELCKALPQASCSANGCEYSYGYGDRSFTKGIFATETFTLDEFSFQNIGFGCGEKNEGGGFEDAAGLIGFGRGELSLVSQLNLLQFSYCLSYAEESKSSILLIGPQPSLDSPLNSIKSTPLIRNPVQSTFYYLSLTGITVGGIEIPIDTSTFELKEDGSGGLFIDSGTTLTYLEYSAFDLVRKEFTNQIDLPVISSEVSRASYALDLCFELPEKLDKLEVPRLAFHFDGADLDFPAENYLIADRKNGVMCLMMDASKGFSIFGNLLQQEILFTHDLEKETLSFAPTECNRL